MIEWKRCVHCIAQPRLYSREQSSALAFAVICFLVDAWAIVSTVESLPYFAGAPLPGTPTLGPVFWVVELLLAIAVFLLLAFAFSTRPSEG